MTRALIPRLKFCCPRHRLRVVEVRARRDWRAMGVQGYADAKSYLTTVLKRRWGAAFRRANSRLRFKRLEMIGGGPLVIAEGEDGAPDVGGADAFAEGVDAVGGADLDVGRAP